jgi:hypothetical protein
VPEGGQRFGDAVDGFFGIVLFQRVIGIGVAGENVTFQVVGQAEYHDVRFSASVVT